MPLLSGNRQQTKITLVLLHPLHQTYSKFTLKLFHLFCYRQLVVGRWRRNIVKHTNMRYTTSLLLVYGYKIFLVYDFLHFKCLGLSWAISCVTSFPVFFVPKPAAVWISLTQWEKMTTNFGLVSCIWRGMVTPCREIY